MSRRPARSFRGLWISLVILCLLILALFAGASIWFQNFLRSETFRRIVSEKTGAAFQAEATYGPFQWVGSSVHSDMLDATGEPGSPLQVLRANQIRAEINWRAVLDGAWRVNQIEVVQLSATLRKADAASLRSEEAPPVPAGGLAALLPQRFELENVNIARTDVNFLGLGDAQLASLKGSSLRLKPDGKGWAIEGAGGTFSTPMLPQLDVETFRSRIQRGSFFLTDARLRLGDTGKITASGEFSDASSLRLEWEQVNLAQLKNGLWGDHLTGLLSGSSTLAWSENGLASLEASGKFLLNEGLLEKLPIQDQIATFTGSPQFRRMPLQEVSGHYEYSGGQVRITAFIAESKGLLRVEGDCQVGLGGALTGKFQIGVTPQTLQWLPGSRERVFTVARNGYLWTDMQVSGTIHDLREDLSARLAAAMGEEVIQRGVDALQDVPGTMREGAKSILDILAPPSR